MMTGNEIKALFNELGIPILNLGAAGGDYVLTTPKPRAEIIKALEALKIPTDDVDIESVGENCVFYVWNVYIDRIKER